MLGRVGYLIRCQYGLDCSGQWTLLCLCGMCVCVQDLASRTEQVYELAAVMYRAAQVEDGTSQEMSEKLARLEYENRHLREVLQLSCPLQPEDQEVLDRQNQTSSHSPEQWPKMD